MAKWVGAAPLVNGYFWFLADGSPGEVEIVKVHAGADGKRVISFHGDGAPQPLGQVKGAFSAVEPATTFQRSTRGR